MSAITTIPGPRRPSNFKAVYDADLIVNLQENQQEAHLSPDRLDAMIAKNFLTESGRTLAKKILFTAEIAESAEKKN